MKRLLPAIVILILHELGHIIGLLLFGYPIKRINISLFHIGVVTGSLSSWLPIEKLLIILVIPLALEIAYTYNKNKWWFVLIFIWHLQDIMLIIQNL